MAKHGDGVNYAKFIDPKSENIIDPGLIGGKVRVMQDYFSIAASNINSTNYVIVGGKLPTGSQVVDIKITGPAGTTASNTVVVGDEGSANRYITSYILTAGEVKVGPTATGGMYYTVTGTTDNYIRIAGAASGAVITGATVKISVMYVVE